MEAYVKLRSEAFVRVSVLRVLNCFYKEFHKSSYKKNGTFNPNNENELKYEFVELPELFAYYM